MPDTETLFSRLGRRDWTAAALLAAGTFLAFVPALNDGFINLDDPHYVVDNPHVSGGLSPENIRWAFVTYKPHYWHPLTWLSLQLDASLWWPNPLGFHLTNMLLHALNAALLFIALRSLTGAIVRSVIAAALFAVHPLRVESVVWVTERKDVLGTLFGLLALWAYAEFARRSSVRAYLALVAAFALSLMCKPMLVTLPCLLLVLDWWPLSRWQSVSWRRLLVEKLPLFALTAASAAFTFRGHLEKGPVVGLEHMPLAVRCGNAAVAYVTYLAKTVWPENLAIYYPHPLHAYATNSGRVAGQGIAAGLVLVALTAAAVWLRRRAPYLLAGWLWFLGTLVPVIGIVQVGQQAYADRFTYFPQIGILVAVAWGTAALAASQPRLALAAAGAVVLTLALVTQSQLAYWRDPVTLWEHSMAVTGENPTALSNLADALAARNQYDAAIRQYRRAVDFEPEFAGTHDNLANALVKAGKFDEAVREYEEALRLDPNAEGVLLNLGLVEARRGNLSQAVKRFSEAIQARPDYAEAHSNLAIVYTKLGQRDAAGREYAAAVRADPRYAQGHYNFGVFLVRQGQLDEAVEQFEQAIRLDPGMFEAHFSLGQIAAARGDLAGAAEKYRDVLKLRPDSTEARSELGIALLRQGRMDDGLACLSEVVERNPQSAQAHGNLGRGLAMHGEWQRAIQELQTAIRINPDYSPAWFDLGQAFSQLGQASEAIRCLERALALEPSSPVFRKALEAARQASQGKPASAQPVRPPG
jgi:tetratricopeptide (TPR) repeat protein